MFGNETKELLKKHIESDAEHQRFVEGEFGKMGDRDKAVKDRFWGFVATVLAAATAVMVQNFFLHGQTLEKTDHAATAASTAVAVTSADRAAHAARDAEMLKLLRSLNEKKGPAQ